MLGYYLLFGAICAVSGIISVFVVNRYYRGKIARNRAHYWDLFQEGEKTRGLFMAAFHAGTEGLLVVDLNGEVLGVNRAFGAFFDLEGKEFLKKPVETVWGRIAGTCRESVQVERILSECKPGGKAVVVTTGSGKILRLTATMVTNVMREDVARLYVATNITEEICSKKIQNEYVAGVSCRLCEDISHLKQSMEAVISELGTVHPQAIRSFTGLVKSINNIVSLSYALQNGEVGGEQDAEGEQQPTEHEEPQQSMQEIG